jgi:hypothetical protein
MEKLQTISIALNFSKKGSLAILTHHLPKQMSQDGNGVQPNYRRVYAMGKEKSGYQMDACSLENSRVTA